MTQKTGFHLSLFYSYSHKDHQHRARMEAALTLLRTQDGVIREWSDRQILPGQPISQKIQESMKAADIFVFLVSTNFIASEECRKEWLQACTIAKARPSVVRVPIILGHCSWKELEGMSDLKALPNDGKPIKSFQDRDLAWQQVYRGLKSLVDGLRADFTVRPAFRQEMERTDFISADHVRLQSIFVFPRLSSYVETKGQDRVEETIDSMPQLLRSKHLLLHGDDLSGKTALCRRLFLSLADQSRPVLYLNLATLSRQATPKMFSDAYERQCYGDYSLWKEQKDKVIILDNLSRSAESLQHVSLAVQLFEQVVVTLSSHTFYAYFRDDDRLATFRVVEILPLTHNKQEHLIRQWLSVSAGADQVPDGKVDKIENQVNAIVISNKIVPRYPFYVLSILQTYEAFMPGNLAITSHGHCYHALIIAHLLKAGISRSDDEIDSCLNFSEHLAYEIHCGGGESISIGLDAFEGFVEEYKKTYLLKDSTLNRLCDQEYGIVGPARGQFRSPYMHYYFLGRFLAKRAGEHREVIEEMLDRSYAKSNCLTLIFLIHHASDNRIIEDIVLRNMCTLDEMEPATLDRDEAKVFEDIVAAIPAEILSEDTVEDERRKERSERDEREKSDVGELDQGEGDGELVGVVNDVYRILKNNEILGQVLKNKYGSLERETILEVIEAIADGGLRLVRLVVGQQEEMNEVAAFVHKRRPTLSLERIKNAIRMLCFLWTMGNIEMVVQALNKPEIRTLVEEVVKKKSTPAYDVIGYFLQLDTVDELSSDDYKRLRAMLGKYKYPFLERVLSLRTQRYLNTHKVRRPVEQAVCAVLGIKYRPRLKIEG